MPRLAMLITGVLWGIFVGAAQAQAPSGLNVFEGSASNRAPAPPPRIFEEEERTAPIAAEPQPISNQELAIRSEPTQQPYSVGTPVATAGMARRAGNAMEQSKHATPQFVSGGALSPVEHGTKIAEMLADDENEPSPTTSTVPLPVPLPPPKLDRTVTPVSYQENTPAANSQRADDDSGLEQATPENKGKTPLSSPNHQSKILLPPNSKAGAGNSSKSMGGLPSLISIAGSTGLVLGIFFLLVWIVRRKTPQALVRLPGEAFEILGRAPLNGRQQVQLLRCGNRLLLVSVTPGGAETLTEITDSMEVDRLSGLCRQSQPGSSSAAFKQVFEQLAPRRPRNESLQRGDEEYEMSTANYSRSSRAWEDRHV
jgi:flagellar biogenesis protein FliO